jgi:hypothetical protein
MSHSEKEIILLVLLVCPMTGCVAYRRLNLRRVSQRACARLGISQGFSPSSPG